MLLIIIMILLHVITDDFFYSQLVVVQDSFFSDLLSVVLFPNSNALSLSLLHFLLQQTGCCNNKTSEERRWRDRWRCIITGDHFNLMVSTFFHSYVLHWIPFYLEIEEAKYCCCLWSNQSCGNNIVSNMKAFDSLVNDCSWTFVSINCKGNVWHTMLLFSFAVSSDRLVLVLR